MKMNLKIWPANNMFRIFFGLKSKLKASFCLAASHTFTLHINWIKVKKMQHHSMSGSTQWSINIKRELVAIFVFVLYVTGVFYAAKFHQKLIGNLSWHKDSYQNLHHQSMPNGCRSCYVAEYFIIMTHLYHYQLLLWVLQTQWLMVAMLSKLHVRPGQILRTMDSTHTQHHP